MAIRSAAKRLLDLGALPQTQTFGVELDSQVHRKIGELLHEEFNVAADSLMLADFFEVMEAKCQLC